MTGGNRLEGDNAILLLEFLTLLVGILYSLTQLYYVRVTPAKVRDEWLLIFSVFHCRCTSWGSTTLHPSTECWMYSCCWYVSKRVRHDVASPPPHRSFSMRCAVVVDHTWTAYRDFGKSLGCRLVLNGSIRASGPVSFPHPGPAQLIQRCSPDHLDQASGLLLRIQANLALCRHP